MNVLCILMASLPFIYPFIIMIIINIIISMLRMRIFVPDKRIAGMVALEIIK